MIRVVPSESRYSSDYGWLKNKVSFSVGEYFDPDNIRFGPLRVFNEDVVQPSTGFGAHGHQEMEIVTIVLEGQLEHRDNFGNAKIVRPGEVQRMSAGTGIVHSEVNPSPDEEVRFLQIWLFPNQSGLKPSYEQKSYDREASKNRLLPIVSGRVREENAAFIHQDATLYLSELEPGKSLTFAQDRGRRTYLFLIDGEVAVNGSHRLVRGDAARIVEETALRFETSAGSKFLLIDLP